MSASDAMFIHSSANLAHGHLARRTEERVHQVSRGGARARGHRRTRMDRLEARIEFLTLVNTVLIELLEERDIFPREAIQSRLDEVDRRDGAADLRRSVESLAKDLSPRKLVVRSPADMRQSLADLGARHRRRKRQERRP